MSDDSGICEFTGDRTKMITTLERQVAEKFTKMLRRVRWRFSDTTMANAISKGGIIDMTMSEADMDMIDVATEA